jgi:ankyrin repeat protein
MAHIRLRHIFLGLCLSLFVSSALPLAAQTVALGQFAHTDFERNNPATNDANLDLLLVRLAAATPYTFVERAAVDRLIAEQALSKDGFAREDNAARLGRLLHVDIILTGTFFTPPNQPPYVVIEAVEAARAEVLSRTEVRLSSILQRNLLAQLSATDADTICQAAVPILAEAVATIQGRPRQVLLKFFALPDLTGSPLGQRFGDRLVANLRQRTGATLTQRLLQTDRPDTAAEESELRMLGLVEGDRTAWEQFADYYIWGVCQDVGGMPVLRLSLWDGESGRRELVFPLTNDPSAIDGVIQAANDAIIAATVRPTRLSHVAASGDGGREAIAGMLMEIARKVGDSMQPVSFNSKMALRLAIAAAFFDPSKLEYRMFVDEHRWWAWWDKDPIRSAAERTAARVRLRSQFLVGSGGKIQGEALFADKTSDFGCLHDLDTQLFGMGVASARDLSDELIPVHLKLWERLVADTQIETERAAERLATAAPDQEGAFCRAAELIFADAFQPMVPRSRYTPDPVRTKHIIDLLWPRLKIADPLSDAWNGDRDVRKLITEFLYDQNFVEAADKMGNLAPDELAKALAAPAPSDTECAKELRDAERAAAVRDQSGAAEHRRKSAALRLHYDYNLRACSTEPLDLQTVIPLLLAGQSWAPRTGREFGLAKAPPDASDVFDVVNAYNLPRLASYLKRGVQSSDEAVAFVLAIRNHRWLIVDYLLQNGCDRRAASWGEVDFDQWRMHDIFVPAAGSLGEFALAETYAQNRIDLAERLMANGVRFQTYSHFAALSAEHFVRRRDLDGLKRLLTSALSGDAKGGKVKSAPAGWLSECLVIAIERRDLSLLRLLLSAGCNINSFSANIRQGAASRGDRLFGEAKKELPPNALCLAAATGWRQGVEFILAEPSLRPDILFNLDEEEPVRPWPHQYATDPGIRALLLRASMRAALGKANAPAVDLMCGIAGNNLSAVAAAWRNPAARECRLRNHSPLTYAIIENRPEVARWLVVNGAPVEENGVSPLLLAIRARQEPTALELLNHGASIQPVDDSPEGDPLFEAVSYNLVSVVDRLLRLGAKAQAIHRDVNILFPAARSNNPVLIQRFVSLRCNLKHQNRSGATALAMAVTWGAAESTAKLLALGLRDPLAAQAAARSAANEARLENRDKLPYVPDFLQCFNLMVKYGQISPSEGTREIGSWQDRFLSDFSTKSAAEIEAFVKAGGSVESFLGDPSNPDRLNLLQSAAARGNLEQVGVLLALGAKPDQPPRAKGEPYAWHNFVTPLISAAYQSEPLRYELVKLLLDHGARADLGMWVRDRPAVLAAVLSREPSPATVRLLLDHGAIIDANAIAAFASYSKSLPKRLARLEAVLTTDELRRLRGGNDSTPPANAGGAH